LGFGNLIFDVWVLDFEIELELEPEFELKQL